MQSLKINDRIRIQFRLKSDGGLPYIKENGPKLKFKGKGFEADDLNKLCMFYKNWAHGLAPKLNFDAFIDKVDKMCRERSMKHYWNGLAGRDHSSEVANANLVGEDGDDVHFELENEEHDRHLLNIDYNITSTLEKGEPIVIVQNPSVPRRSIITTDASFGFEDSDEDDIKATEINLELQKEIHDDDEDMMVALFD